MAATSIYIIHSDSKIETLYTLFPLLVSSHAGLFRFLHKDSKAAQNAEGDCVVLLRVFKGDQAFAGADEKRRALIADFRKRFNRVVMLDDGAGSDSLHFEYMDLVDLYYKGKLLSDKNSYLQPRYGRQIFSDYYHHRYGVNDEVPKERPLPADPKVLEKLSLSWNLGMGAYPMPNKYIQAMASTLASASLMKVLRPMFLLCRRQMIQNLRKPVNLSRKIPKVQARFSPKNMPNSIGYQRKILLAQCSGNERVLSGKVTPALYNKELKSVAAVLSPFGWGEVCFRDFEAIFNGSLLIKPNVDHLATWPNVYCAGETYLPIDWEGSCLEETIRTVTTQPSRYQPVAERAREVYLDALLAVDELVYSFYEEIMGWKKNMRSGVRQQAVWGENFMPFKIG